MKIRTRADLNDVLGGHLPSAALNAALASGLFWRLAEGPQSSNSLAQAMGIPPKRCDYWLRLLASIELLDLDGELFSVSSVTRELILGSYSEETWKMLAVDSRDNFVGSLLLFDRLSAPDPAQEPTSHTGRPKAEYVQKMIEDPDRAWRFTRMLFEIHTPLARHVADALDLQGASTLMDVGGGSGVVSLALLSRHPELTAVVADLPYVCRAGREIAAELPEFDRITYHPADLLLDELPKAFDLILKCDVYLFEDTFLAKLAASLNPGGRLVIVDRWYDPAEKQTPSQLAFQLAETLRDPEFDLRTLDEVRQGLARAGLVVESVEELPYNRWTMLQARKPVEI